MEKEIKKNEQGVQEILDIVGEGKLQPAEAIDQIFGGIVEDKVDNVAFFFSKNPGMDSTPERVAKRYNFDQDTAEKICSVYIQVEKSGGNIEDFKTKLRGIIKEGIEENMNTAGKEMVKESRAELITSYLLRNPAATADIIASRWLLDRETGKRLYDVKEASLASGNKEDTMLAGVSRIMESRDEVKESFDIIGVYRGKKEVVDTAKTSKEADYLVWEYQTAFGRDWSIYKKGKGKDAGRDEGQEEKISPRLNIKDRVSSILNEVTAERMTPEDALDSMLGVSKSKKSKKNRKFSKMKEEFTAEDVADWLERNRSATPEMISKRWGLDQSKGRSLYELLPELTAADGGIGKEAFRKRVASIVGRRAITEGKNVPVVPFYNDELLDELVDMEAVSMELGRYGEGEEEVEFSANREVKELAKAFDSEVKSAVGNWLSKNPDVLNDGVDSEDLLSGPDGLSFYAWAALNGWGISMTDGDFDHLFKNREDIERLQDFIQQDNNLREYGDTTGRGKLNNALRNAAEGWEVSGGPADEEMGESKIQESDIAVKVSDEGNDVTVTDDSGTTISVDKEEGIVNVTDPTGGSVEVAVDTLASRDEYGMDDIAGAVDGLLGVAPAEEELPPPAPVIEEPPEGGYPVFSESVREKMDPEDEVEEDEEEEEEEDKLDESIGRAIDMVSESNVSAKDVIRYLLEEFNEVEAPLNDGPGEIDDRTPFDRMIDTGIFHGQVILHPVSEKLYWHPIGFRRPAEIIEDSTSGWEELDSSQQKKLSSKIGSTNVPKRPGQFVDLRGFESVVQESRHRPFRDRGSR